MRFTHGNSGDALRTTPDALFTPTDVRGFTTGLVYCIIILVVI